jgi:hypothetical protein
MMDCQLWSTEVIILDMLPFFSGKAKNFNGVCSRYQTKCYQLEA